MASFIDNFRQALSNGLRNGQRVNDRVDVCIIPAEDRGRKGETTLSYEIDDNNTGEGKYVKVDYDMETNAPIRVFDFSSGSEPTVYEGEAMRQFFDGLKEASDNYTVYSAPIDITDLSKIPKDYDERATVFYDTDAQGEFDPYSVFNFGNRGAVRFGKRGASRFKSRYDAPTNDFIEELRRAFLEGGTAEKDGRVGGRFGAPGPYEA